MLYLAKHGGTQKDALALFKTTKPSFATYRRLLEQVAVQETAVTAAAVGEVGVVAAAEAPAEPIAPQRRNITAVADRAAAVGVELAQVSEDLLGTKEGRALQKANHRLVVKAEAAAQRADYMADDVGGEAPHLQHSFSTRLHKSFDPSETEDI